MREMILSYEGDVVVIGAGPAGSTAAKEICSKGYRTLLIEKDAYPGENNVCAGGIEQACAKNLNLPDEIIEKRISKLIYYFPWKTYTQEVPHISVLRRIFDRYLAEKAVESGAELHVSTLAFNVIRRHDGIVVYLKNRADGEIYEVKAKLAIFADGPNTLVSRKFKGIGFRSDKHAYLAATYDIEWKDNPCDYFEFIYDRKVSPWGYGWIFPKKDLVNVGVGCSMSKLRGNIKTSLDFLVNRHLVVSRKLRERPKIKFSADIIPFEHADKICDDRILVVGDAAGMVDPLWGGGIRYAVDGGMLAGKVAVEALKQNSFDKTFLSRFEREWKEGEDYKHIKKIQLVMKLFTLYSRFDKNAYLRLHHLLAVKGGARKLGS